jgi:hypothetical protein
VRAADGAAEVTLNQASLAARDQLKVVATVSRGSRDFLARYLKFSIKIFLLVSLCLKSLALPA